MPRQLDKHYNDFGGLDNRTNKFLQNKNTARSGQNFIYDEEDALSKRLGFQHKTAGSTWPSRGTFKYIGKNIDTGKRVEQLLGLTATGKLQRLRYVNFTMVATDQDRYYTLFYNSTTSLWNLIIYTSALAVTATLTFNASKTLSGLKTDIDALAIANLTVYIFDENGDSTTSTEPAYLMDVVYQRKVTASQAFANPVYFWQDVPGVDGATGEIQFPLDGSKAKDYQGLVGVNLYNCAFLTDGQFVIKYDGYAAYRAGMPKNYAGLSGIGLTGYTDAGGSLDTTVQYLYKFQYGFRDPNGAFTFGQPYDVSFAETLAGTENAITVYIPALVGFTNSYKFPVWSCIINGNQNPGGGATTAINVVSGHNVQVGMCMRYPYSSAAAGYAGFDWAYYKVTAVTATTITIQSSTVGVNYFNVAFSFPDDFVFNFCFVPEYLENEVADSRTPPIGGIQPPGIYGAFVRLLRSKGGETPLYHLMDISLPEDGAVLFDDIYGDTELVTAFGDLDQGGSLPRACTILSEFQGQIIQSGRPSYAETLRDERYPSASTYPFSSVYGGPVGWLDLPTGDYSENHICDAQSIYWNDPVNPEGFPQSGLNEESFETVLGDKVSGMYPNLDGFVVFKSRGMAYLVGSLATGDLKKEVVEIDVGTSSHKSIQEVSGNLIFLDPNNGFYSYKIGTLPSPLGYKIVKDIKDSYKGAFSDRLNLDRAVAINYQLDDNYLCYIPESYRVDGQISSGDLIDPQSQPSDGSDSVIFVYDYSDTIQNGKVMRRNMWTAWKGILAGSGFATINDRLFAMEGPTGAAAGYLWAIKRSNSSYDYSDHTSAINWIFNTAHINYGNQSVDKDWFALWVNSLYYNFTLIVKAYLNYRETTAVADYTLTWPSSEFSTTKQLINLPSDKSSALSIGFENNVIYENPRIAGFEIEFAADFDLGEAKT